MLKNYKIKIFANNFEVIQDGTMLNVPFQEKKIPLKNLNYWNVELQKTYFFLC